MIVWIYVEFTQIFTVGCSQSLIRKILKHPFSKDKLIVYTKVMNVYFFFEFQSLTTLKNVPSSEFGFLRDLPNLEELEIGECSDWDDEVRTHHNLGNLCDEMWAWEEKVTAAFIFDQICRLIVHQHLDWVLTGSVDRYSVEGAQITQDPSSLYFAAISST